MRYDYILSHTPRQIAEENPLEDIESACSGFPVDDFGGADGLFGGSSITDWYDNQIDEEQIEYCDQVLRECYDERDLPRPGDARDLAVAYQLVAAWSCKLETA